MKGNEIKVGEVYRAKVSGILHRVRIDLEIPYGRGARTVWHATNLETGRRIVVKSAQRLRPLRAADAAYESLTRPPASAEPHTPGLLTDGVWAPNASAR